MVRECGPVQVRFGSNVYVRSVDESLGAVRKLRSFLKIFWSQLCSTIMSSLVEMSNAKTSLVIVVRHSEDAHV